MIIVRVELHSARTGEVTELARMHIMNESGGGAVRDYSGVTFIGRSKAALDKLQVIKRGIVQRFPAEREHVWNLVARILEEMGYGR